MTVTDLTLFRLHASPPPDLHHPPSDEATAKLRSSLAHYMREFKAAAGHLSAILQDAVDPSEIYIIGAWDSVDAARAFNDSKKGKDFYAQLSEVATLEWIGLYELDHVFGGAHAHLRDLVRSAPILGVGRNNVAVEDVKVVEELFKKGRISQDKFSGFKGGAGWKVYGYDAEGDQTTGKEVDGRKEFIVFSGWESVEKHNEFPGSEHYMEYAQIREYVKWFERKNLKLAEYDDKVSR